MLQNIEEGKRLNPGNRPGGLNALFPDSAGRSIDYPEKTDLVLRVGHDAEIRENVFDLGPIEKACTADHAVRNPRALEGKFKLTGLGICAVKNGVVPPAHSMGEIRKDRGGDRSGFLMLITHGENLNGISASETGPEFFAFAGPVVADDVVGRFKNMLGAAIVLFQTNGPAALELVLKGENIFNCGAAETVDALVIVTDDAEIAVLVGQKRNQQILQMVGILILVYHDILKAPLPVLTAILKALQQKNGIENQVIKVHGVG